MIARILLDATTEFLHLIVQVLPFFLLGAFAGAALQTFLSDRWSQAIFGGRGARPLFAAVAAGALLPGCSCTTIPMASGLRGTQGARLGTVAAFILVSPLLSPITVALTWGMLGWEMAVARTLAAVAGSLALGAVINRFEPWFASVSHDSACEDGTGSCCKSKATVTTARPPFGRAVVGILRQVTPYFLLGLGIAAVLAALLPADGIPALIGDSSGPIAYALAALIGIPLYVCEGEEVPITYALLRHGLGPGPGLTFLLGSVGTCIPTFVMARRILGSRATTLYIIFWFAFAISAGLLFEAAVR